MKKHPGPAAKARAPGGQLGVSHIASLGFCFPIWNTEGNGIPPSLPASMGHSFQLPHPQALPWPCSPSVSAPFPQAIVEQCPSQGTEFPEILRRGLAGPEIHLLDLWAVITHLHSCLLNHRNCSSWVCPVSPASAITCWLCIGVRRPGRISRGLRNTDFHSCSAVNSLHGLTPLCLCLSFKPENHRNPTGQSQEESSQILASLLPIHLIGEDLEARGERGLFTKIRT